MSDVPKDTLVKMEVTEDSQYYEVLFVILLFVILLFSIFVHEIVCVI